MKKLVLRTIPLLILIPLTLQSCSSPEETDLKNSEPPFKGLPELEVTQIKDITDENASEFFFASNNFHHMAISNDGSFFVSNRGNKKIYHFNRDGEYLSSIGQEGRGPGEFQLWPKFDIATNNSLFTLDEQTGMVSRFSYQNGEWNLDSDFQLNKKESYSPENIFVTSQDKLLIEYHPSHSSLIANLNSNKEVTKAHSIYTSTGELIEENWLEVPFNQRMAFTMERGASVTMPFPYASKAITKVGQDDNIYLAWTKDFNLKIYDLGNSQIDSIKFGSANTPLTEELRQQALDSASLPYLGTGQAQEKFEQALFDRIPTTAPALSDMHIDRSSGDIIVQRFTFSDEPNWMLLDQSGNRVGVFRLDEDLKVFDYRDGRIIGSIDTDKGFPAVRVVELGVD
jgi:hypothetical protein